MAFRGHGHPGTLCGLPEVLIRIDAQVALRQTPFTSETQPKTCYLPVLHRELLEKTKVSQCKGLCEGENVG